MSDTSRNDLKFIVVGDKNAVLISGFHRASLISVTFINQLMHSIVVLSPTQRIHTHHRFRICRQTSTTHIINTFEPLYKVSREECARIRENVS